MTNITASHRRAFKALISGRVINFALVSCFVDQEPSAAIAAVEETPGGDLLIQPLFVAVTETMALTNHDGCLPGSPDSPSTLDLFEQTR